MASAAGDWRVDVLKGLGAPVTPANLRFLEAWQHKEGGHTNNAAHWNYLNTTSGSQYPLMPGSDRVRSYPNYATGVRYTVSTIESGRYASVVRGLRSGNPYNPTLRQGILGDLSTWVSGSRSANLTYGAGILGDASTPAPAGHTFKGGPLAGVPVLGPAGRATTRGLDWLLSPVDKTIGVAEAPFNALEWVGSNWDRVLEVLGGVVLVIIGLAIMGRSLGVTKTKVEIAGAVGAYRGEREYAAAGRPGPAKRENLRRRTTHEATDEGERRAARRERAASRTTSSQSDEIPF